MCQALATTFFGGDDSFSPFFGSSDRSVARVFAGAGEDRQLRGITLDVVEVCMLPADDEDSQKAHLCVPTQQMVPILLYMHAYNGHKKAIHSATQLRPEFELLINILQNSNFRLFAGHFTQSNILDCYFLALCLSLSFSLSSNLSPKQQIVCWANSRGHPALHSWIRNKWLGMEKPFAPLFFARYRTELFLTLNRS